MRPVGKALAAWWLVWTVLIGLGWLAIGIRSSWDADTMRVIGPAALIGSALIAMKCARSWWATVRYQAVRWWR